MLFLVYALDQCRPYCGEEVDNKFTIRQESLLLRRTTRDLQCTVQANLKKESMSAVLPPVTSTKAGQQT